MGDIFISNNIFTCEETRCILGLSSDCLDE